MRGSALLGLLVAGLLAGTILAGTADDLAREIGQAIGVIAAQVGAQPERALAGLAEQRRRLETLAQAAPEHPALPELRRRLDELDRRLTRPEAAAVVASPPVDVARLLARVRARLREAEGALLSKDNARASAILQEIEASLTALRRERADEIPQGHVVAFVLEERIAVLKRQLAEAGGAPR